MPHLPWSPKHTPEELLELATIDLKSACKENNSKKSLKLVENAKSNIDKAEKVLEKGYNNLSLKDDIAKAYHEHGSLLDKLGDSKHAQESYSKAQKWGYTREVSEHNLSSQSSEKSGSSDQSVSHLGSLSPSPSPVIRNLQVSDQMTIQSPSNTLTQKTTSSKVDKVGYAESRDVGHIPPSIFNKDGALQTAKYPLPEIGGRITSSQQLVYCLGLLTAITEELEPNEQNWVQKIKENEGEKERLNDMANDMIRAFVRDELKDDNEVDEVVWLAPVLSQGCFRNLLQILVDGIKGSTLLKVSMVNGLVHMMRNSGSRTFNTDDLVKILDLLSSRLENTHDQSNQLIYKLTLAVSAVLDSMADNKVVGLSREQLHDPLFKYLQCLMDRPEPYLIYQAAYTFQALQYVPNDESQFQAIQRTGVTLLQGVIGVAKGAKGMDIGGVIDGLKKIRDAGSEIARPFVFNIKANIESGQSIMSNLKDGFRFKRDWYPALRAIDISFQNGRLTEVKQIVNQAPSYLDLAFQLGLCQRLGELAINPLWDRDSRHDAIDLLVEMYKNDIEWGRHDEVKKWILYILSQLKDSSDGIIFEKARNTLQDLKTNGDTKKQDLYHEYEKEPTSSHLLTITLPPKTSRLCDQIHSKPGLSATLTRLKSTRTKAGREELYISPMAKRNLNAKETETFELKSDLQKFLKSDKKVFLIQGDSGSGKSTFNRMFEMDLWEDYNQTDKTIPLFIHLPSIKNPEEDLIAKHLRKLDFTKEHIQELKNKHDFILICDGYDETQSTRNFYMSNELNQGGGWRAQMVISCRTEYNGMDYKDRFQPIDTNTSGTSVLFQEAVIVPFDKDQIQGYIERYVSCKQSAEIQWGAKDYEKVLDQIPTLRDLVKNPFLLKLAMEVLPRLVDLKKGDLKSQKITRIALYDEFVILWLERNKKRTEMLKHTMSKDDLDMFNDLCEEGFFEQGISYIKDLAKAIYLENKGNPVFTYSNKKGQNSWQAEFFNKKVGNHILQQAIPLIRSEKQYRFLHKSILEYGLTLSVFDQITKNQIKESVSTQSFRRYTSYVRGAKMEISEDDEEMSNGGFFIDTPFGKKSFVNEPSILQFLVERVQQQPSVLKELIEVIELSKTNSGASTAAANAITVLNRAGVQFNGADLRGIKVPGADLSCGVFDSAQLEEADLREANLRNIWLLQANLEGAQMDGVLFGELPFLQEDEGVRCCAYSSDGDLFATGLRNGTISLYKTSNWNRTHILTGHDEMVTSISFSSTNNRIASGSGDSTVRVWDVDTGECVRVLQGHSDWVGSVVYSPKGGRVASGSNDKTVRVWDVDTGECLHILQDYSNYVMSVAYSPKGGRIASGSDDSTVRLWDVDTGECIRILEGHSGYVRSVVYSPKGDRIASGSDDSTVRLWDVDIGECVHTLQGHSGVVLSVVYSPKGNRIASGGQDTTVRLWDVDTGECLHILQGHGDSVNCVVYSPEGYRIASGSADKTVRLWDVDTGEYIQTSQGHSDWVRSVVYSPKGDRIASGSEDKTVRVWDVDTGECVYILQGHSGYVISVVYSPKGDRIVSGSNDSTVRLWDVDTGDCVRILQGHSDWVMSVVYSPKGDRIASGSEDKTVRVWDVDTGECVHILQGHILAVMSVAYSPKGDRLASGSEDRTVRVWDVYTGECVHILQGHSDSVRNVVYSPKGDRITSGSNDSTVRLWDVDTGECVHILQGHSDWVISVVYSPKGDQIASGSDDSTVRLWNAETGQCELTIAGFNGAVFSLGLRNYSDCLSLVSGSMDRSVRHWKITKEGGEQKSALCWTSSNGSLTVVGASFNDVQGLSLVNEKLLIQRKAIGFYTTANSGVASQG